MAAATSPPGGLPNLPVELLDIVGQYHFSRFKIVVRARGNPPEDKSEVDWYLSPGHLRNAVEWSPSPGLLAVLLVSRQLHRKLIACFNPNITRTVDEVSPANGYPLQTADFFRHRRLLARITIINVDGLQGLAQLMTIQSHFAHPFFSDQLTIKMKFENEVDARVYRAKVDNIVVAVASERPDHPYNSQADLCLPLFIDNSAVTIAGRMSIVDRWFKVRAHVVVVNKEKRDDVEEKLETTMVLPKPNLPRRYAVPGYGVNGDFMDWMHFEDLHISGTDAFATTDWSLQYKLTEDWVGMFRGWYVCLV